MVMGYVYVHHAGSGKIVLLIYGRICPLSWIHLIVTTKYKTTENK